jgi:hypothetical protein
MAGLAKDSSLKWAMLVLATTKTSNTVALLKRRSCRVSQVVCARVYTVRVREISSGIFESAGPVLIFSIVSGDG